MESVEGDIGRAAGEDSDMTAKLAFVVLAHRNPKQVGRLVQTLGVERTFLHIDSGTDSRTHKEMIEETSGVALVARHRSAWASWGIVEAILEGARAAAVETTASHVVVLSGQDFPLVPVPYMEELMPIGESFMRAIELPVAWLGPKGGLDRLYDFNWSIKGHRLRVPARRKLPAGVQPFTANPWVILARHHVHALLDHMNVNSKWWRRVWIPDELFAASVLGTFHRDELLDVNPSYTEWSPPSAHPDILTGESIPRLLAIADQDVGKSPGRKWFARKFDDEDGQVFEELVSALAGLSLEGKPL